MRAIAVLVCLACCVQLRAKEPPAAVADHANPRLPPATPNDLSAANDSPAAISPQTLGDDERARIAHLFSAADHLAAAGLASEAIKIRKEAQEQAAQADASLQQAIAKKSRELATLQAKLRQLQSAAGTIDQYLFQVRAYEINRTKMRSMGMDFDFGAGIVPGTVDQVIGFDRGVDPHAATLDVSAVAAKSQQIEAVFKALTRLGVVRVLPEPRLATVNGRPARLETGGTSLEIVPSTLANRAIKVEWRLSIAETDDERAPAGEARKRCVIDTCNELQDGQTVVLKGLRQLRRDQPSQIDSPRKNDLPATEETELLVFLTTHLVKPRLAEATNEAGLK